MAYDNNQLLIDFRKFVDSENGQENGFNEVL